LHTSLSTSKTRPAQSPATGRARLSLDLDGSTKENFEALRERTGTGSLTDLIKKSVALFDVATDHQAKGGALIFRHKDGREERLVLL
jgi:hypothetical protein